MDGLISRQQLLHFGYKLKNDCSNSHLRSNGGTHRESSTCSENIHWTQCFLRLLLWSRSGFLGLYSVFRRLHCLFRALTISFMKSGYAGASPTLLKTSLHCKCRAGCNSFSSNKEARALPTKCLTRIMGKGHRLQDIIKKSGETYFIATLAAQQNSGL